MEIQRVYGEIMKYPIEFVFPEGDQVDLERNLREAMIERAISDPQYAFMHQWGEFFVKQGNTIHGVQWRYIGLEIDYNPLWSLRWEDEDLGPDFEVECSWHEEEL
jgi:hypothetical protein